MNFITTKDCVEIYSKIGDQRTLSQSTSILAGH